LSKNSISKGPSKHIIMHGYQFPSLTAIPGSLFKCKASRNMSFIIALDQRVCIFVYHKGLGMGRPLTQEINYM